MTAETHAEHDGLPVTDIAEAPRGFRFTRRAVGLRAPAIVAPTADVLARRDAQDTPTSRVMHQLIEQTSGDVALLHHRRTPRIGSTMDHVAVAASGVWIIASHGDAGRIAARRPMFGDPRLTIGGHDRSDLLLELDRQVSFLEASLALEYPDVAVRSAICFVDTEAPLVGTPHLGSYLFFGTPSVVKHLNSDGPVRPERVRAIAELLEIRFPAA